MTTPNWTIAFDADDTLWHNERAFRVTQDRFVQLLENRIDAYQLRARLLATERRNLSTYGFGIKGFVLSMIETAIEVTDGSLPSHIVSDLIAMGREMLSEPVEVFDGVQSALEALKPMAEIILITKGDLLDQERKLAQSGLSELFDAIEIVSDKTVDVYSRIFARHDTAHQMMVGNSLLSDVVPALEAGAWGVHVPHDLTWEYEADDAPSTHRHFRQIASITDLPKLVADIS